MLLTLKSFRKQFQSTTYFYSLCECGENSTVGYISLQIVLILI